MKVFQFSSFLKTNWYYVNNKVSFLSNSVRDQCAQWFMGFSLEAYRIPLRDHCILTELSQSGRFVTIMSDFSHPVNIVFWLKRIINDRFPFFFLK